VFWDVFPATVGTQFERHYRAAATEGKPAHFTDAYDDGRLALVSEADVAPVTGGGVAVFWRDITARVRVEAALRESETRFRNMADAAPVMLWVTEPDGSCSFLSRAWLDFTGQTLAEGLGFGWLDAVHPEDRPRAERDFVEANARREPFRADYRLRRHDGAYRWATDAAAPRLGPGGEYLGYVGSVLDVDERARLLEAERAARVAAEEARASAERLRGRAEASEALARQLFALSPVPKWVYDAETLAFLDVNEAAVRHYGYTREEFLAMTIRDIRPPEEIPRMLAMARALHPTGASQGVFHHRKKSGEVIDVEVFLRDVPYEARRAVIAVVQDVTERRRSEAALREASRAAAAARDLAEEANAAKTQFLSTMSHELRTPLNAIGGYADLLTLGLRGPLTEAQRHDLERIRLANQHLMGLVTDVLNFARLDAGHLEYRLTDVELAPIVADLEPLIGPQLAGKGIAFEHDRCAPRRGTADAPGRAHRVRADPERLRQILLNLLTNAVKFTEAGGRVALACETDDAAGVFRARVSDTGRGIPADQLERIFEPFVQVDRHRTPESQQGVGLGLAISRELARGMGGDLTVESTPGVGSTFTLTLPRA
jgi:PAS domain S-box-containing protein